MQLVEQHMVRTGDARFDAIDRAAFAAKNLYNAANYQLRQAYIREGIFFVYKEMNARMKGTEQYQALPRKVSQQVLRLLDKNWQSFFALRDAWLEDPKKFRGRPGLPRYLEKQTGRFVLVYTIQALSRTGLRRGMVQPSGLNIEIETKQTRIAQVRIVPKDGYYMVEVVYERDVEPAAVDPGLAAAKAELVGIQVVIVEESHTSKCSFLDNEPIKHQERYAGRRIQRGLFRSSDGRRINADVNGSYNILRKAIPNAFGNGTGGVVVHPVGSTPTY